MTLSFQKNGFTIIELLVVVSIIGLLSSVVLVATRAVRLSADDGTKALMVREFINGIELFYSSYGYYPTPSESMNFGHSEIGSTGYTIYATCLKLDSNNICTYRNLDYIDPTFINALSKFIITPARQSLPVLVVYPNTTPGHSGTPVDVGGIEYDCTPVAPNQPAFVGEGNCMSYMINFVYQRNDKECAGGYKKQTISTAKGYQNTNTACVYTNNDAFVNAFWNHPTLPSPFPS